MVMNCFHGSHDFEILFSKMDTFNFDALGVKFTHKIRHGIRRLISRIL